MAKSIKTSIDPFTLSPDLYAAIGEVTVCWSATEDLIASGLALLLKADRGHFIAISANMNVSAQLDSIKTLCHLTLPDEKRKPLVVIVDRARSMNTERNKIVHGRWMQTDKAHKALCIVARAYGAPTEERKIMTAKSIRNFAKQIRELSVDLTSAYIDAGLFVPPDPLPPPSASIIKL